MVDASSIFFNDQNGESMDTLKDYKLPYNKLLVRRSLPSDRIGTFYVPEVSQEIPADGVAVLLGPGVMLDSGIVRDYTCAVGDWILFGKYGGSLISLEEGQYMQIDNADIVIAKPPVPVDPLVTVVALLRAKIDALPTHKQKRALISELRKALIGNNERARKEGQERFELFLQCKGVTVAK